VFACRLHSQAGADIIKARNMTGSCGATSNSYVLFYMQMAGQQLHRLDGGACASPSVTLTRFYNKPLHCAVLHAGGRPAAALR
jgi:hypothetical protein